MVSQWADANNVAADAFLAGSENAFGLTNSLLSAQGRSLLYCQPPHLGLASGQDIQIFRTFLREHPKHNDEPATAVLLLALKATFPCVANSRSAEPAAETSNNSPAAGFQWAMSSSVIGLNPAFIEAKLGPAREKSDDNLIFEVEGCVVSYSVKGTRIVSASSVVNSKCQPVINGRKITPEMTFGSLIGGYSKIISTCIFSCGNAYDPTIDVYTPGYHANGFIDVIYQGGYGDVSDSAMHRWANAIRRQHGVADDDFKNSSDEWFSCVSDPPLDVANLMRAEHVSGVTIGREIKYCSGG
jgi:hypothetical protein